MERLNRTLSEKAGTQLIQVSSPLEFLGEEVPLACKQYNKNFIKTKNATSFELLIAMTARLRLFKVIGSIAKSYFQIESIEENLQKKARCSVLLTHKICVYKLLNL